MTFNTKEKSTTQSTGDKECGRQTPNPIASPIARLFGGYLTPPGGQVGFPADGVQKKGTRSNKEPERVGAGTENPSCHGQGGSRKEAE
ncbi:hypothetical protein FZEAL_1625 [Fusarium zealandicum]|uniref:Uncharacterized protein n=1 Tax=Fusarium zealandicum TaxID=1053134 RepID=A0A8H4USD0_9HYPO|nr:hypothetical protein FZEAL_1625 [Fusarium zealandicum]